jgi:hypothetical protein
MTYQRFTIWSERLDLDATCFDATTAAITYRLAAAFGRTDDLVIAAYPDRTQTMFDLIPLDALNLLAAAERREEMFS